MICGDWGKRLMQHCTDCFTRVNFVRCCWNGLCNTVQCTDCFTRVNFVHCCWNGLCNTERIVLRGSISFAAVLQYLLFHYRQMALKKMVFQSGSNIPLWFALHLHSDEKGALLCSSNVMWSSKMSLNSKTKYTDFCFIVSIISRAIFDWKPHQNWTYRSRDIVVLVMLKTINYKGNWMLLLSLSKNQY